MANESKSEVKSKDSVLDVDFQWGTMPKQELSGQFTRSMMEMRKPKPYELLNPSALHNEVEEEATGKEIDIPRCPITTHSIQLIKYIRQVQDLLSVLESRDHVTYDYSSKITELYQPPILEESTSSSLEKSTGIGNQQKTKLLFSAPDLDSKFRSGFEQGKFPKMDEGTASRILKKSVAAVAAHAGFEQSRSSALIVLTGVAEAFMISFSNSLRLSLDSEAETGRTAFYDSLDQAVHDSGLTGIKDIRLFWKKEIVQRHKRLQKQAERLSGILQSSTHRKQEEIKSPQKPERMENFVASYEKWTPVAGMSSSPFPTGRPADATSGVSQWISQAIKPEPRQNNNYNLAAPSQSVKTEFGNLDTSGPGIEYFSIGPVTDAFVFNDQQTLYGGAEDFRSANASRNT